MKTALATGTTLFVLAVLLGIAQMWYAPLDAGTFFKVETTLAALIVIVIVVAFVIREAREYRRGRGGDTLD